tara:strand:+ start:568 stop:840 length:273 start_codon:yes stop_codon:yes gene_type:complete
MMALIALIAHLAPISIWPPTAYACECLLTIITFEVISVILSKVDTQSYFNQQQKNAKEQQQKNNNKRNTHNMVSVACSGKESDAVMMNNL